MFTISKDNSDAIKQVCQSAASRSPIAAFQNVLIKAENNQVTLTAGDSVIELTKTIEAQVELDCAFQVDATKFLQSFNACKKDVQVTVGDLQIEIKSGRSKFKLAYQPADVYPSFPSDDDLQLFGASSMNLVTDVQSVAFAAAKNDVRFMLNGVHISDAHVVATNGHRMAWADHDFDCDGDLILPIEFVNKAPLIDGATYYNNNIIALIGDNEQFKCKLIDAKYVDYRRAIFEKEHQVDVNKADFIDAIKSAMITSNTETKSILLHFGKESYIESKTQKDKSTIGFECSQPVEIEGFEIGSNSSYLLDAVNSIEPDQVAIGLCERGFVISDENINNIIMRVKV